MSSQSNEFAQASKDPANAFHISPTHTEHAWTKSKDIHGKERVVKSAQQVVINQKKRTIILPADNVVPAAFGGSTVYSDWTLPSTMHVFNKAVLEFTIKNNHTAALSHYPTAHLIDHIEIFSGSTVIEYITRHQLYLETSGFIDNAEFSNKASDLGESAARGAATTVATTASTTLRVRINSLLDSCGGLFVSGFRDSLKIRIHWSSAANSANGDKYGLTSAQLYLTELILPDHQYQAQMKVHRNNSASYRCVVRNQQDVSFASFSSTATNQITLNALRGLTCCLFVAAQAQNSTTPQTYDTLGDIQMKQSDGTKMTELMTSSYILKEVAVDLVKNTNFFNSTNKSIHPIPFAIAPIDSIKGGIQTGYTHLDSKERLEVRAASDTSNRTVFVMQYSYATLSCTKGRLEVSRT